MPEIDESELPKELRGKYDHALAAVNKNNHDYAILLLKDLLKQVPGFVEGRIVLRESQRKKKGGSSLFSKIVGTAASSPALAKGEMALRKGDHATAMVQAEEVLTDDPGSKSGHRLLAEAANAMGLPRVALGSVQLLVKLSPENKGNCQLLANILEKLGDYDQAEEILGKLVDKHPGDFKLRQIYKDFSARATINRGKYEKLSSGEGSVSDVVRDKDEEAAMSREQLVRKPSEVIQQMIYDKEQEFQRDTNNLRIACEIAKLNMQAKNFDRALEYYDFVATNGMAGDASIDKLISDAHHARFDHRLEQLDKDTEDYQGQKLAVEKEIRVFQLEDCRQRANSYPSDMDIRFELGVSCFKAELYDEAVQAFQRAQTSPQYKHRANSYLGQCFAVREMYELAERSLLAAIDEHKGFNELRKEVVYNLAGVYEKMGRNEEAFERYQEVYEQDVGYRDVSSKVDNYYTIKKSVSEVGTVGGTSASPAAGSVVAAPRQSVGNDRFTLLRQLGRGGMGVVWLARDGELSEDVALKLLPEEMAADLVALNELKRETSKSRRLSHPNIVRTHDLVQMPNEPPFISMEFVDGGMLEAMRLEQPGQVYHWSNLEKWFLQLCDALEYAHGQKIVHRDLKPANMMITQDGDLKLADFGIAASMADSLSRSSMRNVISGTATYMSPQQLQGDVPRATDDIYAMGGTLYELLSGRPPFYTGDLTYQIINVEPHPLAERLREMGVENEIPPHIDELVMACLAKETARRPQSASVVAEWIRTKGQSSLIPAIDEAPAGG
ncbi:MAG: protein kinase [Verrucomicrobiota bacterium]|nr:protein kinase [Verrucomicrobiota bacterium]